MRAAQAFAFRRAQGYTAAMTNRLSLAIIVIVLGLVGADHLFNHDVGSIYVLRKMADLIEWVAFWR